MDDVTSYEWQSAVMKTYRALDDFEGAVLHARSMYDIARANVVWLPC
jgi:hypothetical protein